MTWVIFALDIFPIIFTIIGNSIFIVTILKIKSLQTPPNLLLLFLCITDLMVGFACQPLFICLLFMPEKRPWVRVIMAYNLVFFVTSFNSFLSITMITFNRFYAAFRPLKYRKFATKKRFCCIAAVLFTLSTAFAIIDALLHTQHSIAICASYLAIQIIIVIAIIAANCWLCSVISGRNAKSVTLELKSRQNLRKIKEREATKTIAIISSTFLICHMPYIAYLVYYVVAKLVQVEFIPGIGQWGNYFVLLQSALNPVILLVRRDNIKLAATRILCRKTTTDISTIFTMTKRENTRGFLGVNSVAPNMK